MTPAQEAFFGERMRGRVQAEGHRRAVPPTLAAAPTREAADARVLAHVATHGPVQASRIRYGTRLGEEAVRVSLLALMAAGLVAATGAAGHRTRRYRATAAGLAKVGVRG